MITKIPNVDHERMPDLARMVDAYASRYEYRLDGSSLWEGRIRPFGLKNLDGLTEQVNSEPQGAAEGVEDMMHTNQECTNDGPGMTRWELNAFWAMSALGGALLAVVTVLVIPRLLAPVLVLPFGVWAALAFLVLGLAMYPVRRTQARLAQPTRKISFKRFLVALLVGLVVAALVYFALSAIGLDAY